MRDNHAITELLDVLETVALSALLALDTACSGVAEIGYRDDQGEPRDPRSVHLSSDRWHALIHTLADDIGQVPERRLTEATQDLVRSAAAFLAGESSCLRDARRFLQAEVGVTEAIDVADQECWTAADALLTAGDATDPLKILEELLNEPATACTDEARSSAATALHRVHPGLDQPGQPNSPTAQEDLRRLDTIVDASGSLPVAVGSAGSFISDTVASAELHDGPPRILQEALCALEVGFWWMVLHGDRAPSQGRTAPAAARRLDVALRLVARSMRLQAQGRLLDAWDRLGEAAGLLPPGHCRSPIPSGGARAVLTPQPRHNASIDEELAWRTARLIWREQYELTDLRRRFASDSIKARDELIEACIQHLSWVEFDPSIWYRPAQSSPAWDDAAIISASRLALCKRGTYIRRFANPAATAAISQSPWQDIGGHRGLLAEALTQLADRPVPAPWCGTAGTSGLVVRRGRLRAWQHARAIGRCDERV